MKMTKNNLIELYIELTKNSKIGNAKFKYGCLKNLKLINSEIESLKEIEKEINDILVDYNNERNEIIKKYGTIKENGSVSISPSDENFSEAITKLEELNLKYKDVLEQHSVKFNEYQDLLNEEVEFDFKLFEISIDNVPDEIENLNILMDFNIVK